MPRKGKPSKPQYAPRSKDIASTHIYVRVTPEMKKEWKKKAKRLGVSMSRWIVETLNGRWPRDPRLPYSRLELATALGRHVTYVSMMFRAGCPKDAGARSSLEGALAWLKANPDFNYKRVERTVKAIYPNRNHWAKQKRKGPKSAMPN